MSLNEILRRISDLNLGELEQLSQVVESFSLVAKAQAQKASPREPLKMDIQYLLGQPTQPAFFLKKKKYVSRLDLSLDALIELEKEQGTWEEPPEEHLGDSLPGTTTWMQLDRELNQIHKARYS